VRGHIHNKSGARGGDENISPQLEWIEEVLGMPITE